MSVVAPTVKKFLNNPEDVVKESLAGLGAAHPDLVQIDLENQLVLRKDAPVQGKVALVSGGGSGHEPLHGGFVGKGMLDAACPGEVFTSPVPDQMRAATKAVDGGAGVVHVVKNYTGDVMNFKLAAELAEDELVLEVDPDEVGMRRAEACERFLDDVLGAVEELLDGWSDDAHGVLLPSRSSPARTSRPGRARSRPP